MDKATLLETLHKKYKNCRECTLGLTGVSSQVVFGTGSPHAKFMFIGEAPGRDEDLLGIPFVGRSGQLLTWIIQEMGFSRDEVYITNINKRRPPGNRTPTLQEREKCKTLILLKEIEIIQPKIICTLGSAATKGLLGDEVQISKTRGQFFHYKDCLVMPTFHPAYLLRNPAVKQEVLEDMKKIMAKLKELE